MLAVLLETIRETCISLTIAFLYSSLAIQSFPAQHCNASSHGELAADHFCGRVRRFSVEAAVELLDATKLNYPHTRGCELDVVLHATASKSVKCRNKYFQISADPS